MLEAIADCPSDIGEAISSTFWFASLLSNVFVVCLQIWILKYLYQLLSVTFGMSSSAIAFWGVIWSVAITVILYIYYVYLVDFGTSKRSDKTKKN
jgi:hypothetical protein